VARHRDDEHGPLAVGTFDEVHVASGFTGHPPGQGQPEARPRASGHAGEEKTLPQGVLDSGSVVGDLHVQQAPLASGAYPYVAPVQVGVGEHRGQGPDGDLGGHGEDEIVAEGGFWTTASAMGEPLLARLGEHAGVTFTIED